jgi:hypothetical protein
VTVLSKASRTKTKELNRKLDTKDFERKVKERIARELEKD